MSKGTKKRNVREKPIGVFDSGLGGLTVVKEIKKILPFEKIVYLGDTARVPYGPRSKKVVTQFSFENAKFLLKKDIKALVVACNTSSAFAGELLKRKLELPVFEVVGPGAYGAVGVTKNKKIGVIGTRGTIASGAYKKKILKLLPNSTVYSVSCPLFVPVIEEGELKAEILELLTNKYLKSFKKEAIDTLILGCTHYPIIASRIGKAVGKKVKLVNPGKELAKELKIYLQKNDLDSKRKKVASSRYYVTDLTDRFLKVAKMFLGKNLNGDVKSVSLES